ncbi:MAG: YwiC-like family protein [Myxococcales bacterium]
MRSLAPREHGAWGQLGFPLLTALCAAWPRPAGLLFAASAVALFLAHEPALVAFGRRGERVREEEGGRALRVFLALLAAGGALGAAALWLSPAPARLGAAIAAGLAALLMAAVALGIEKTLPGELIAAAAMTSAALPVAAADGIGWTQSVSIWGAWLFGFAAAVFPVRAVIVEHKARVESPAVRVTGTLLAIAFAAALAAAGELPPRLVLAAAPLFAASIWIALRPPAMKRMTQAGWTLMAAGALTTVLMVVAVR